MSKPDVVKKIKKIFLLLQQIAYIIKFIHDDLKVSVLDMNNIVNSNT